MEQHRQTCETSDSTPGQGPRRICKYAFVSLTSGTKSYLHVLAPGSEMGETAAGLAGDARGCWRVQRCTGYAAAAGAVWGCRAGERSSRVSPQLQRMLSWRSVTPPTAVMWRRAAYAWILHCWGRCAQCQHHTYLRPAPRHSARSARPLQAGQLPVEQATPAGCVPCLCSVGDCQARRCAVRPPLWGWCAALAEPQVRP